MTMEEAEPFGDSDAVLSVGDLTVEVGSGEVLLHGSLSLRRDRISARRARVIADFLQKAAALLDASPGLPEAVDPAPAQPLEIVANPFG